MNNISYLRKSLFKKLSAIQVYLIRMHCYAIVKKIKLSFFISIACFKFVLSKKYIFIYMPNLTGTLSPHFNFAIENHYSTLIYLLVLF